jgi:hypothetical protein
MCPMLVSLTIHNFLDADRLMSSSIVQQSNSWDRFKISWTGFLIMLGGSDTYGPFFDLVSTFGLKHNPHDEGLSGFTYRVNSVIGKQLSYGKSLNSRIP